GENRARDQRDHHQKPETQDERERQQPMPQEPEERVLRRGFDAPYLVQRALQLDEYRRRAEQHQAAAEDDRHGVLLELLGIRDDRTDERRTLLAGQLADLVDDLLADGALAEEEACRRDHDQEQRRHRQQRVIRQGRCEPERLRIDEGFERLDEDEPDRPNG